MKAFYKSLVVALAIVVSASHAYAADSAKEATVTKCQSGCQSKTGQQEFGDKFRLTLTRNGEKLVEMPEMIVRSESYFSRTNSVTYVQSCSFDDSGNPTLHPAEAKTGLMVGLSSTPVGQEGRLLVVSVDYSDLEGVDTIKMKAGCEVGVPHLSGFEIKESRLLKEGGSMSIPSFQRGKTSYEVKIEYLGKV